MHLLVPTPALRPQQRSTLHGSGVRAPDLPASWPFNHHGNLELVPGAYPDPKSIARAGVRTQAQTQIPAQTQAQTQTQTHTQTLAQAQVEVATQSRLQAGASRQGRRAALPFLQEQRLLALHKVVKAVALQQAALCLRVPAGESRGPGQPVAVALPVVAKQQAGCVPDGVLLESFPLLLQLLLKQWPEILSDPKVVEPLHLASLSLLPHTHTQGQLVALVHPTLHLATAYHPMPFSSPISAATSASTLPPAALDAPTSPHSDLSPVEHLVEICARQAHALLLGNFGIPSPWSRSTRLRTVAGSSVTRGGDASIEAALLAPTRWRAKPMDTRQARNAIGHWVVLIAHLVHTLHAHSRVPPWTTLMPTAIAPVLAHALSDECLARQEQFRDDRLTQRLPSLTQLLAQRVAWHCSLPREYAEAQVVATQSLPHSSPGSPAARPAAREEYHQPAPGPSDPSSISRVISVSRSVVLPWLTLLHYSSQHLARALEQQQAPQGVSPRQPPRQPSSHSLHPTIQLPQHPHATQIPPLTPHAHYSAPSLLRLMLALAELQPKLRSLEQQLGGVPSALLAKGPAGGAVAEDATGAEAAPPAQLGYARPRGQEGLWQHHGRPGPGCGSERGAVGQVHHSQTQLSSPPPPWLPGAQRPSPPHQSPMQPSTTIHAPGSTMRTLRMTGPVHGQGGDLSALQHQLACLAPLVASALSQAWLPQSPPPHPTQRRHAPHSRPPDSTPGCKPALPSSVRPIDLLAAAAAAQQLGLGSHPLLTAVASCVQTSAAGNKLVVAPAADRAGSGPHKGARSGARAEHLSAQQWVQLLRLLLKAGKAVPPLVPGAVMTASVSGLQQQRHQPCPHLHESQHHQHQHKLQEHHLEQHQQQTNDTGRGLRGDSVRMMAKDCPRCMLESSDRALLQLDALLGFLIIAVRQHKLGAGVEGGARQHRHRSKSSSTSTVEQGLAPHPLQSLSLAASAEWAAAVRPSLQSADPARALRLLRLLAKLHLAQLDERRADDVVGPLMGVAAACLNPIVNQLSLVELASLASCVHNAPVHYPDSTQRPCSLAVAGLRQSQVSLATAWPRDLLGALEMSRSALSLAMEEVRCSLPLRLDDLYELPAPQVSIVLRQLSDAGLSTAHLLSRAARAVAYQLPSLPSEHLVDLALAVAHAHRSAGVQRADSVRDPATSEARAVAAGLVDDLESSLLLQLPVLTAAQLCSLLGPGGLAPGRRHSLLVKRLSTALIPKVGEVPPSQLVALAEELTLQPKPPVQLYAAAAAATHAQPLRYTVPQVVRLLLAGYTAGLRSPMPFTAWVVALKTHAAQELAGSPSAPGQAPPSPAPHNRTGRGGEGFPWYDLSGAAAQHAAAGGGEGKDGEEAQLSTEVAQRLPGSLTLWQLQAVYTVLQAMHHDEAPLFQKEFIRKAGKTAPPSSAHRAARSNAKAES
ncbi:hypothetical protein V8C86DRAFT_2571995 [Haematococcus lacustris]